MFYYQEQQSIESPALFNLFLSTNLLVVYAVVIAFVLSPSFSLRRPSIAAIAVEFAFGCLMLITAIVYRLHCQVVRLFGPLGVVILLRRSGALSVCRSSPTIVAVDFILGRLVLQ